MKKPLIERICQCGCKKMFSTRNYKSRFMVGHRPKRSSAKYKRKYKVQENATIPYSGYDVAGI